MPDIDPSKVLALLEDLLGPRRGRQVATGLASLTCVAVAVFLSWVIWAYGGKVVFDSINDLLSKVVTGSDLTAAAALLVWVAILYGLAFVAVLYFLGRTLFRRSVSQSALDELARLRNQGIKELYACAAPKNDDEFKDWKRKYKQWHDRLFSHVKANFPEADYLSLEYLGLLEGRSFSNVYNGEHETLKGHLAKRIEIIEQILAGYRR